MVPAAKSSRVLGGIERISALRDLSGVVEAIRIGIRAQRICAMEIHLLSIQEAIIVRIRIVWISVQERLEPVDETIIIDIK
jgi:hypothetical protein